jgi:hypothetical protein
LLFLLTLLTLLQQERKPDMKTPIETFSNWVRNGKDDGMEKNHLESVSKMFDIIVNSKGKFSIIEALQFHILVNAIVSRIHDRKRQTPLE